MEFTNSTGFFILAQILLDSAADPPIEFRTVRISITPAILLCLLAIAIPAWLGFRGRDYLTPPDDQTLHAIRNRIENAIPRIATEKDAISPVKDLSDIPTPPTTTFPGDLSIPPHIDEYSDRVTLGASSLIELANRLEDIGHAARALLAWERVIDQANASAIEQRAAKTAIARLRESAPPWLEPDCRPHITIHAGTSTKSMDSLLPALENLAAHLSHASGGTLAVEIQIHVGEKTGLDGMPVPIAIWISNPEDASLSTEVLSLDISTPEAFEYEAAAIIYTLVQNHLRNNPKVNTPPNLDDEIDPRNAWITHISRLQWHTFGNLLSAGSSMEK